VRRISNQKTSTTQVLIGFRQAMATARNQWVHGVGGAWRRDRIPPGDGDINSEVWYHVRLGVKENPLGGCV